MSMPKHALRLCISMQVTIYILTNIYAYGKTIVNTKNPPIPTSSHSILDMSAFNQTK